MAKQSKSTKNCSLQAGAFWLSGKAAANTILCLLLLALSHAAVAEILNSNTTFIRIRLGDNSFGSTNTVIYNAGIPADMGGLPGVAAQPSTISTNVVAGGSGVFEVRVVTDLNARSGLTSLTGTFAYDSSQPMTCTTPATCGAEAINFNQVSWNVRDNDTHASVTQYDGSASQVANVQIDTNPATNGTDNRHRNYFQYVFDNATMLPAGTYEGTITLTGTGNP